ncbi:MAG: phosphatidate cytidylyltransferase [Ruminococcaceae bacterium]|nr:phosphatidate cytidylyltransferase [Oscillospiraceae bacterium]
MLVRIISAAVGLVIMLAVMFSGKIALSLAVSLVSALAVYEALKAYGYNKKPLFVIPGFLVSFLYGGLKYIGSEIIFLCVFGVVVFFIGAMLLLRDEVKTKDLFTLLFITLIIPFSFSTISYIRDMEKGIYLVWLPFISAWLTDTFAYFGGRFLGKHKLCPEISPKKTVEGAIFGIIGAIFGYVMYSVILKNVWNLEVNIYLALIMAVVTSVLSQMGDLFASCIKRENGVKDFGKLMPGHGGALDRFDSLLLTAPVIYICLEIFKLIY